MRYIACAEPLGLEQVGAGVSAEHDVRLVDMQVRPGDLTRTLKHFTPHVAGVTTETARVGPALDVLRTIRRVYPECLTVVGGHHPSVFPGDFDDPAVDLVVVGEGFHTFREICQTRSSGGTVFDHIPGLMIRTSDGLQATEPRPLPQSMDGMPLPDRSLTAPYRKWYYYILEPSVASMATSFGCKNNCSFCPGALVYGRHYISRDPQLMFDEICTIKERYIKFADNGSFHDADSMGKLGRMLLDAGIKKRYFTFTRADAVVRNPELFELWKRAGLSLTFVGIESLDDEALGRMNKGQPLATMEKAVNILEDMGMPMAVGFVIPPDAGPDNFDRFDRFLQDHPMIHFAEFTPLTPFRGTRFYEEQRDNIITHDRQVYDMQHFVVKTALPQKELYDLMTRSYLKNVRKVIWRERFYLPWKLVGRAKWRLYRGLIANGRAFKQAHRHVIGDETETTSELPSSTHRDR